MYANRSADVSKWRLSNYCKIPNKSTEWYVQKTFDQRGTETQLENRSLSKWVMEYNPANKSKGIKVERDGK